MKPLPKNRTNSALINTAEGLVGRVTDRGIDWVFSSYVLARADVFRTPPEQNRPSAAPRASAVRRVLDQLREEPPLGRAHDSGFRTTNDAGTQIAGIHAQRDDEAAMFEWLQKARKAGDPGIVEIRYMPFISRYSEDPRFIALARDLDLLPDAAEAGRGKPAPAR